MSGKQRISIVGGGINGVASAYAMLQEFSNVEVTIYSHLFSPYTTSDGAGGLWEPYFTPGTPDEDIIKWSKSTWDLMEAWWEKRELGIQLIQMRSVSQQEIEIPCWRNIPFNYRSMDQQELKSIGSHYVSGHAFKTYVAETNIILPKLMDCVKSKGGKFEMRNIRSLKDLGNKADIIVNCSGIGSRDLVPDTSVFPVRGQVMRVRCPKLNYGISEDSEEVCAYVIPNTTSIVLGGTHQENDWNTTIDINDSRTIWENCSALAPELKDCEVIREWVGLRPARRRGIRLEEDEIRIASRTIPVVHNYGHGGSGITTFWGCAQDVSTLVGNIIHRVHGPTKSKL